MLRDGPPDRAKVIVRRVMNLIAEQHRRWIASAEQEQKQLESEWSQLSDDDRRKMDVDRRRTELASRLQLAVGYASYRMAELERRDAAATDSVFGSSFDSRLEEAGRALRNADAAHPNHYLVLQLLGLVYSEPRREGEDLNIAEQYFARAIRANPSDYYGHELLASVLLRRVTNLGVDESTRSLIEKGLDEARAAASLRETSGRANLLRAEFQTRLLELERNEEKRMELRAALQQYIDQADRFLPRPFGRHDVDLAWVQIVAATRAFGEKADRFGRSKEALLKLVDQLIADCELLEARWVAYQRVFEVERLHQRALRLRAEIANSTPENWRGIRVPFF
jgi:hypothetical protein